MTDLQLYNKLISLPDDLKKQVEDFIDVLADKTKRKPVKKQRVPGLAKGLIKMSEDFDAPLDDFKDYM